MLTRFNAISSVFLYPAADQSVSLVGLSSSRSKPALRLNRPLNMFKAIKHQPTLLEELTKTQTVSTAISQDLDFSRDFVSRPR